MDNLTNEIRVLAIINYYLSKYLLAQFIFYVCAKLADSIMTEFESVANSNYNAANILIYMYWYICIWNQSFILLGFLNVLLILNLFFLHSLFYTPLQSHGIPAICILQTNRITHYLLPIFWIIIYKTWRKHFLTTT